MSKDVLEIEIKGVFSVVQGYAIFVGTEAKVFIIYVDQSVGSAINMFLTKTAKERPLTHDLITHIFSGFGISADRVVINDLKGNTYYARLFLRSENELGKKLVEIDSRPSDALALAVQQGCKIYCNRAVFDQVDDMSEVLDKIKDQSEGES
ncbi:MAG: bifunctional nuclease family protein [Verrucomicrobiae bacterium]|nr:bifunctional nuclease family protein [Verrucomicrobiae bacterium]